MWYDGWRGPSPSRPRPAPRAPASWRSASTSVGTPRTSASSPSSRTPRPWPSTARRSLSGSKQKLPEPRADVGPPWPSTMTEGLGRYASLAHADRPLADRGPPLSVETEDLDRVGARRQEAAGDGQGETA